MSEITRIIELVSSPISAIVGMLFVLELSYYTDNMKSHQRIFNVISIPLVILFTVGWAPSMQWLRIIFSGIPFVLNALDIIHLKGEKGYVWANIIEMVFLFLMLGGSIFIFVLSVL
ncbi:hypothetical protein KKA50_01970 [Patescibacteria group bacterium]|nr:hypothetical protein [Patescibacteria group bacterium]